MTIPDVLLPETAVVPNVTTGHDSHHDELRRVHNLGADAIIIPAKVDGTDCTSMVNDIIADAPAQSVLRFREPGPVRCQALDVIDKPLRILGAGGRWGTRLVPSVDTSDPIISFDVPAPGDPFAVYGPSVERLAIDMRATPSATGLRTSSTTGWFEGYRLAMYGGTVHVDNRGANNRFERFRFIDAGKFFAIDGETGLELTLKDGDCVRNGSGTTSVGIEVICTTGTTKGDLRLDNMRINSAASGGAVLSKGLLVQSTELDLSVPVFANKFVVDNAAGPSIHLINVRDAHFADGWGNSAAGATAAVLIEGGGNVKFKGNTWFGGTRGTYEFAGTHACVGFISQGNYCPSAYVYRLAGAGKPTDLFLDDFVPGATADSQITDDLANLVAGRGRTWGGRNFMDLVTHEPEALKTPTFVNSWANVSATAAGFWRDSNYVIHFSGIVTGGAAQTVCTLPTGYRPVQTLHFVGVYDDGTTVTVEVTSAGVVKAYAPSFPSPAVGIEMNFRWGGG